jgi:hypothetical protein
MSALIPALIQLAMSRGRGGGGGGGGGGSRGGGGGSRGGRGGYSRGGYGRGGGGRQPFDPQAHLDKEASKDMMDDPFDTGMDRAQSQFWDGIFKAYSGQVELPEPEIPDPFKPPKKSRDDE